MDAIQKRAGVVYGLRLNEETEYRYVGLTESPAAARLTRHLRCARQGVRRPVYDWIRKYGSSAIVLDVLETVSTSREDLGAAEIDWIRRRRGEGDRLLNISDGGLGPTGIVWTEAQREAARIRSTGRPGLSRFGTDGPFYGKHHSEEQKAAWSLARKGTNTGPDNPNFGKFGPDHPSFGHRLSDEARARLSEMRKGPLNPNFGKTASEETRGKRRASQVGISKPSSVRNAHTRYHTNKGVVREGCRHCADFALAAARTTGDSAS